MRMEPSDQKHLIARNPLANYQFSSDELRVLRDCNSESFFQRSLPLGTGLGLAAYFGINKGFLKPNVKYGAVPKIVVGVIVGYFVGKFSYQQKCAEKIMLLPNSKLAEALRQRRQGFGAGLPISSYTQSVPDVYNDEYLRNKSENSFDLDTESRPTISGLDDIYRPSLDNPIPQIDSDMRSEPKIRPTYDELRKQNRDDYIIKHKVNQTETFSREERSKRKPIVDTEVNEINPIVPTNKYGDTWTN